MVLPLFVIKNKELFMLDFKKIFKGKKKIANLTLYKHIEKNLMQKNINHKSDFPKSPISDTKESIVERHVCKFAKKMGWVEFKLNSSSIRGIPDRLFLYKGLVLFVEFKKRGETPTAFQAHIHKLFLKQGFTVYLIDDINAGKDLFKTQTILAHYNNYIKEE